MGNELATAGEAVIAPGMTQSHYAPRARLRLDALSLEAGEVGLDFGGALAAKGHPVALDLSPSGDLKEAAANLFSHLRALDALGVERAAVAPIPAQGLGEAIRDRLRRAAS